MASHHWLWAGLGAAAFAGCIGSIGDPPPDGIPPGGLVEDSGTLVMHRLNQVEYRNTIRDLLGSGIDPAVNFPADDISYGFDNISAVLTTSPVQFELYEQAASDLAEEAMLIPTTSSVAHFEAEALVGSVGQESGNAWLLWSNGEVSTTYEIEQAGEYIISARVWGSQAGPDPAEAQILVDQAAAGTFAVPETSNNPAVITQNVQLDAGTRLVGVAFTNDFYEPPNDRNLYVDWIEIEGPVGVVGDNPIRERIINCDIVDPACARDVIANFAKRAWRRPLETVEIDRLMGLYQLALNEGDTADMGVELALRGILLAPHFIYRPELDDDPTSEVTHELNDYELASRLSYFLWSSMPDDGLYESAAAATLHDEETIRAEVDRMLADDRAEALVENFAGQWLMFRYLPDHVPDYAAFPTFDDSLRAAMGAETRLFFREFLRGDSKLDELLSANFSFLNDRLAQHYGVPEPGSTELVRVELDGTDQRFGLMTQGSLLMLTSYATRTSPTQRGAWIMENLLCETPAPPPAGVEGLEAPEVPMGSLRDILEQHRKDPKCSPCHAAMDPMGFALEHYDGIGAWRDNDNGFEIDVTGEYFSETPFSGGQELAALVQQDPRFGRCMIEKLFTYGLGRGTTHKDEPYVEKIAVKFAESGYDMPELIKLMATSEPFRMRRGTKEVSQ